MSNLSLKTRLYSSFAVNFTTFLHKITNVALIIYAVYLISAGQLTMGGLIACSLLTTRALAPIGKILQSC